MVDEIGVQAQQLTRITNLVRDDVVPRSLRLAVDSRRLRDAADDLLEQAKAARTRARQIRSKWRDRIAALADSGNDDSSQRGSNTPP